MEELKPGRYALYLIERENKDNAKSESCEIRSFYPTVTDEIHVCNTFDGQVYTFFGIHYFLIHTDDEVGKRKELDGKGYKKLYQNIIIKNENLDQSAISKELRGSSTLQLSDENSMVTGSQNRITFDARGLCVNYGVDTPRFINSIFDDAKKSIYCYLLAMAYNKKSEILLSQAIEAFKSCDNDLMIACRDDVYSFDLKYFFRNPVKPEVFETRALWNMAARACAVQENHDEIKAQVAELANVIEARQRVIESRQRDMENSRQQRNSWILQIVGALVALASLISVIKDAQELFGG